MNEIKTSYRRLVLKYHPDKQHGADTQEAIKTIYEAWEKIYEAWEVQKTTQS